nr:hypothetical protein [Sorangium cellulosum]
MTDTRVSAGSPAAPGFRSTEKRVPWTVTTASRVRTDRVTPAGSGGTSTAILP